MKLGRIALLVCASILSANSTSLAKGTHIECHLKGQIQNGQKKQVSETTLKLYLDDTNEVLVADDLGHTVKKTTLYSDTTIHAEIALGTLVLSPVPYVISIDRTTGRIALVGSFAGSIHIEAGDCNEIQPPAQKF